MRPRLRQSKHALDSSAVNTFPPIMLQLSSLLHNRYVLALFKIKIILFLGAETLKSKTRLAESINLTLMQDLRFVNNLPRNLKLCIFTFESSPFRKTVRIGYPKTEKHFSQKLPEPGGNKCAILNWS